MSNTEFEWRGYRIIHTTDKKLIGETKDRFGFPVTQGWIVRDCFDDNPIPPPTQWFYTPYDAIAAVEIVEAMRENTTPWTSFNAAYYGSMHLRNHFWIVFSTLLSIEKLCRDAAKFDDNPGAAVLDRLHMMKARTMMPGYPAPTK